MPHKSILRLGREHSMPRKSILLSHYLYIAIAIVTAEHWTEAIRGRFEPEQPKS